MTYFEQPYQWEDLSDVEVRVRLQNRGVEYEQALYYARRRNVPAIHAFIEAIFERG